ncbi:hypothetical protein QCA50_008345 [Cerrena zonata]|uniref:Uncharacterized protein n=1 Tax=Cerrena zonata TaxID=2478898 RepID=A0AAW0GCB9_9APHY
MPPKGPKTKGGKIPLPSVKVHSPKDNTNKGDPKKTHIRVREIPRTASSTFSSRVLNDLHSTKGSINTFLFERGVELISLSTKEQTDTNTANNIEQMRTLYQSMTSPVRIKSWGSLDTSSLRHAGYLTASYLELVDHYNKYMSLYPTTPELEETLGKILEDRIDSVLLSCALCKSLLDEESNRSVKEAEGRPAWDLLATTFFISSQDEGVSHSIRQAS